jgi:hypothetical protein
LTTSAQITATHDSFRRRDVRASTDVFSGERIVLVTPAE